MKRFSVAILLFISMLTGTISGMGATYKASDVERPPFGFLAKPNEANFLADPDNILNKRDRLEVDAVINATRTNTGLDMAAVLVEDIEGDVNAFAKELYKQWNMGSRVSQDNGVLVVVIKNRGGKGIIYTGAGTITTLPHSILKKIELKKMTPALRNHNYSGTITVAMEQIQKVYADPMATEAELDAAPSPDEDMNIWWIGGILLAAIIVAIVVKIRNKKNTAEPQNK